VPLDLADVLGQPDARRAAEISAAGGHHLFLLGPVWTGKTMVARRIPSLLPPLDPAAALEVTANYSVAGALPDAGPLVTATPFIAPHHLGVSRAEIAGDVRGITWPGLAALAHRGFLLLDDTPEFTREALDALRRPLETGQVVVARRGVTARFPARLTLILAASPCPWPCVPEDRATCRWRAADRRRHLARIPRHLLDRIDITATLQPAAPGGLPAGQRHAEPSAVVAARVAEARDRAARRLEGTPWRLNAEIPGSELRRTCAPAPGALVALEQAMDRGEITTRGVHRVIRVAWTLSDLAGIDRPTADQASQALSLCLGTGPGSPHTELLRSGTDDTCAHLHRAPATLPAQDKRP